MARTARVKLSGTGVADYHLTSWTNDRRFLFEKDEVKAQMLDAIGRAAEFCGIRLHVVTAMDNHFQAVVRVVRTDEPVPEAELIRRVGVLKGDDAARVLVERWEELHAAGFEACLEEEQTRLRARMNDVSAFVKEFKELFDRSYRREHPYTGSIWAGRFKSTLIEDERNLATCIKHVLYSPIRAGLVSQVQDYPWIICEKGAANEVFAGTVPEECGVGDHGRAVRDGVGGVAGD